MLEKDMKLFAQGEFCIPEVSGIDGALQGRRIHVSKSGALPVSEKEAAYKYILEALGDDKPKAEFTHDPLERMLDEVTNFVIDAKELLCGH